MKNLFDVNFEGNSRGTSLVDVFERVLTEEVQREFDHFVHGLYGFAKRHSHLRGERMKEAARHTDLLKKGLSLPNMTEVK